MTGHPRLLIAALIMATLMFAGLVVFTSRTQADQIKQNTTTRIALCALRDDLDKRIASSTEFLADHPHGIPGIPASLIRQGLSNSMRTRRTLDVLTCN